MIQWMSAIWSLVLLPFLNPSWTSGRCQFTYCWSLAWRIFSTTLLACETCAIVWFLVSDHTIMVIWFMKIFFVQFFFAFFLLSHFSHVWLCATPETAAQPGSPVPGILQVRTLDWVAISFSSAWKWKVKVKSPSCVQLLATPWTAAYQAPPSMGFSRQQNSPKQRSEKKKKDFKKRRQLKGPMGQHQI